MKIRTGIGFDVHKLDVGLPLWLGGVRVEHSKGCVAHSDGDVLIHAICDALLGAASMRDIGYHFPDNDNTYKAIDSKILLKRTVELIGGRGFRIGNVDSILCMQRPKLKPHIPEMQRVLAEVMGIDIEDVSVKATTTEQLGFEGREEGVSAYASVLIYKE
ncbi:MAG: 2-C-methyl-D-erythritol 2,4-cyclodiphosphate synthase [Marinifilaceae bacterium]|nr:2-C-methyl-D-erythritol 2,4-cyclodiphosphate synthase [Marinifilaceae bacterium]